MYDGYKMPHRKRKSTKRTRKTRSRQKGGSTEDNPYIRSMLEALMPRMHSPTTSHQKSPRFYKDDGSYVIELSSKDFDQTPKIVHSKFKGVPGMVMWYADWCGHCKDKQTQSQYRALADFCHPDVPIAAFNCAAPEHEHISSLVGVKGYPSITYIKKNGEIDMNNRFKSHRTLEELKKYMCENITKPGELEKFQKCKI